MANIEDPAYLTQQEHIVILKLLNPRSTSFAVSVLAILSLLCFAPVLLWGPPTGWADLIHHVQIANAYTSAFEQGVFFPDWVQTENNGYGSVVVRFYPPLMHVTIALFKLVFGRMDLAFFAALSLWSLIGCLGTYVWLRDLVGGTVAPLAGAIVFGITPYHLNQFYNSFLLGEFVSLCVLPFAFLFIRRLCVDGGSKNVIALALSVSALILSNIPQTIICFPFLVVYALLCLDRTQVSRHVTLLATSGILAAACTAFYWVRVVMEMSWIHISEPNTDPVYDFRNNFLFGMSNTAPEGIGYASLILILLTATSIGLLLVSGKYRSIMRDRALFASVFMLATSILMVLPLSRPLWEAVGILERLQFPWRFLSIVSLASSMIIAISISMMSREQIRERRRLVLIAVGSVLILATFSFKQVILGAVFSEPGAFNRAAESSNNAKGLYHWWPTWADKSTFEERERVIAAGRKAEIRRWDSELREFSISAGEATTVRTAILYYPWWRVEVNGAEVPAGSVSGSLVFDIGPDTANCSLSFREPPYTSMSRTVSAVSVLGILLVSLAGPFRRRSTYE